MSISSTSSSKPGQLGFSGLGDVLTKNQSQRQVNKYVSREYQDYGYRLAAELNDLEHKSLYIKLAKQEKRALLEQARSFVIDSQAKSKAKLFMWKCKQLREEKKKS